MRQTDRQKGFSLIELMVGVTIGMMAVYASYRIFDNVEGNYRSTETVNEAQTSGLYATLAISKELNNAGAGIMSVNGGTNSFGTLSACRTSPTPTDFPNLSNAPAGGTIAAFPLYPLPVAIVPDTATPLSHEVFIFYGTENFTDIPIAATATLPATLTLTIPPKLVIPPDGNGLTRGTVLITNDCQTLVVNSSVPTAVGAAAVTVTVNGTLTGAVTAVVDMGQVVRRRFFVDPTDQTLKMETWQISPAAGANNWTAARITPIASNVIAFNAQYGVAGTAGGPITQWVTPREGSNMPSDIITGATGAIAAQNIKAIRFGLIVKASEPDRMLKYDLLPAGEATRKETFFADCPTGVTCDPYLPTGVTTAATCDSSLSTGWCFMLPVSNAGDAFGWRYRKYETTVPLQNTIWNPS